MVKVGMAQQHMIDPSHFLQGKVSYASPGIDEDFTVDQERRCLAILGNGA
jgi:hypothetical protein